MDENINENTTKKKSALKDWGITILIFIVAFLVFRTFIGNPVVTNGESMSPTLVHGDTIFVNKFIYDFTDPKQGDVVIFPYPADKSKDYIKRIIGTPGDSVDLIDNNFYINGEKLDDPFAIDTVPLGDVDFPITLGDDEYFVLGDNRVVSHDSRYSEVGLISKKDIIGKASFVYYPFDRIKFVK